MHAAREVIDLLLRWGYLVPADVVRDGVRVSQISRRHRSLAVVVQGGPAYLVKRGAGTGGIGSIQHESRVLGFLHELDLPDVRSLLPDRLGYHADADILVLDFLPDARDLQAEFSRHRGCPPALCALLGVALGRLHATVRPSDVGSAALRVHRAPWILSLHRPRPDLLRELSLASRHLIWVLQNDPQLCRELDSLHDDWSPDALIHFDLKWDNCIAYPLAPVPDRLRLIDWEFAGWGDPRWDLGSAFAAFLAQWLVSVPFVAGGVPLSLEPVPDLARHPIAAMRTGIGTFWSAYVRSFGLEAERRDAWLGGALRFAAARLLQTAYEMSQGATRPDAVVGGIVQVASNLLITPPEQVCELIGVAPDGQPR